MDIVVGVVCCHIKVGSSVFNFVYVGVVCCHIKVGLSIFNFVYELHYLLLLLTLVRVHSWSCVSCVMCTYMYCYFNFWCKDITYIIFGCCLTVRLHSWCCCYRYLYEHVYSCISFTGILWKVSSQFNFLWVGQVAI